METKNVTELNNSGVAIKWYEDSEVNINSINGYSVLYRRIFYEKGWVKRIVVGFSEEERDLASSSPEILEALTEAKQIIELYTPNKANDGSTNGDALNKINNAIKKATK